MDFCASNLSECTWCLIIVYSSLVQSDTVSARTTVAYTNFKNLFFPLDRRSQPYQTYGKFKGVSYMYVNKQ